MVIKVLAIGDVGNIIHTISKYTKSEIHIINFFKDGAGNYTYENDVETFSNYKIKDHVKKILSLSILAEKHNTLLSKKLEVDIFR